MIKGKLVYSGTGGPVRIYKSQSIEQSYDDIQFESMTLKKVDAGRCARIEGIDKYGYKFFAEYPSWSFVFENDEQDLNECIGAPEADVKRGGFIPNAAFVGDLNPEPSIMGVPLRKIDGAETVTYPGIDKLITERGSRYGKFKDGAEIMQELKDVMREVDGWRNLTPSQREALDMIQHKIGRILNGDPTYDDSWKDIAGYATLIVNELNGEIK